VEMLGRVAAGKGGVRRRPLSSMAPLPGGIIKGAAAAPLDALAEEPSPVRVPDASDTSANAPSPARKASLVGSAPPLDTGAEAAAAAAAAALALDGDAAAPIHIDQVNFAAPAGAPSPEPLKLPMSLIEGTQSKPTTTNESHPPPLGATIDHLARQEAAEAPLSNPAKGPSEVDAVEPDFEPDFTPPSSPVCSPPSSPHDGGATSYQPSQQPQVPSMPSRRGMGTEQELQGDDDDPAFSPRKQPREAEPSSRAVLRAWWRSRGTKRAANSDHVKMPCWKQYSVLFAGSIVVAMCTVTVTTLFAIISPVTQYFVLFSFSGALPFSIVLHLSVRTTMRYIRKYFALRRGRRVEGAFAVKSARRLQPGRRGESAIGERAEPALADEGQPDVETGSLEESRNSIFGISSSGDATDRKSAELRRAKSAHYNRRLDQVKSLAEHVSPGCSSAIAAESKPCSAADAVTSGADGNSAELTMSARVELSAPRFQFSTPEATHEGGPRRRPTKEAPITKRAKVSAKRDAKKTGEPQTDQLAAANARLTALRPLSSTPDAEAKTPTQSV